MTAEELDILYEVVAGANMAITSFTYSGSEAGSPGLLLRPSPAMGHAVEILDV
jgi:hypothetical protein